MRTKFIIIKAMILLSVMVIYIFAGQKLCFAQGQKGKYGFGIKDIISNGPIFPDAILLGGRYFLSEKHSLDANLGFRYLDSEESEDKKQLLLGIGINQYLKPGKSFSPLIGIDFTFELKDPGPSHSINTFSIDGKFGGEYFFTPEVSLSGELLLGLEFGDDTQFGTGGRLGIIFYL